jgi:hypothetical protein
MQSMAGHLVISGAEATTIRASRDAHWWPQPKHSEEKECRWILTNSTIQKLSYVR